MLVLLKRKRTYHESDMLRTKQTFDPAYIVDYDQDSFVEEIHFPRGRRDNKETGFMSSIREFLEETKLVPVKETYCDMKGFILEWMDAGRLWRYHIFFIVTKELFPIRGSHFLISLCTKSRRSKEYSISYNRSSVYGGCDRHLWNAYRNQLAKELIVKNEGILEGYRNFIRIDEFNNQCNDYGSMRNQEMEHVVKFWSIDSYIVHMRTKQIKHYAYSNYDQFIEYIKDKFDMDNFKNDKTFDRFDIWVEREKL